jgi:hypothetical protein
MINAVCLDRFSLRFSSNAAALTIPQKAQFLSAASAANPLNRGLC